MTSHPSTGHNLHQNWDLIETMPHNSWHGHQSYEEAATTQLLEMFYEHHLYFKPFQREGILREQAII